MATYSYYAITGINNLIISGSSFASVVSYQETPQTFNIGSDFVESYLYTNPDNSLIRTTSPFRGYQLPITYNSGSSLYVKDLIFSPDTDLSNFGITSGNYNIYYNVLRPLITGSANTVKYIKEISPDRTEIRVYSTDTNDNIQLGTATLIDNIRLSTSYFEEFYINFGNNNFVPAINVALDFGTNPYSILVKLISPLSQNIQPGATLTFCYKLTDTFGYTVTATPSPVVPTYPSLRGPNFNINVDDKKIGSTPYYNLNDITSATSSTNPVVQTLLGLVSSGSIIKPNVDYTSYSNFANFSSVNYRLQNFYYKLEQIAGYQYSSSIATSSITPMYYQNLIDNIYTNFDDYENYLFYASSSYAVPKQNSTPPYINYSYTSSQFITWFNDALASSSFYDSNNPNWLKYTLPSYILNNQLTDNEPLFKFVSAVGQVFDDIWVYLKGLTDIYKADNNLMTGVSKDLVFYVLQSFGVKLYTDYGQDDVFSYLYQNGTPTGSNYITASYAPLTGADQQKAIYKRIFHSLPLLLKAKGTNRVSLYLSTLFGVPSTILYPIEYGGTDKDNNTYEYSYDRFSYALDTAGSGSVSIPYQYFNNDYIAPDTIEFRFKPRYTTSSNTQALLTLTNSSSTVPVMGVTLDYTTTGSGIYNGITSDFGVVTFRLLSTTGYLSSSVLLPIFYTGSNNDTSWWNVLIQRSVGGTSLAQAITNQTYNIFVKTSANGAITHQGSGSISTSDLWANFTWGHGDIPYITGSFDNYIVSSGSSNIILAGNNYSINTSSAFVNQYPTSSIFNGYLQEFRIWNESLSEYVFDQHVLNPSSFEGNTIYSAFNSLANRFTLGNNLYTYNHTLTSSVYSTHPDQRNYQTSASFFNFPNKNNYVNFVETYYTDLPTIGYYTPNTNKKVRVSKITSSVDFLFFNQSVQVDENPLTKDINLLEIGLSPQNEVDKDIIGQFGSSYNIDDIIGDPLNSSAEYYPELTDLAAQYFKKVLKPYNYLDYMRVVDTFHNSLFKTLQDFVPARSSGYTGFVYKSHILERNKNPRKEPNITFEQLTAPDIQVGSISAGSNSDYKGEIAALSGSVLVDVGPLPPKPVQTPFGIVNVPSRGEEFYNGDYLGNEINCEPDTFNPYNFGFPADCINSGSGPTPPPPPPPGEVLTITFQASVSNAVSNILFDNSNGGYTYLYPFFSGCGSPCEEQYGDTDPVSDGITNIANEIFNDTVRYSLVLQKTNGEVLYTIFDGSVPLSYNNPVTKYNKSVSQNLNGNHPVQTNLGTDFSLSFQQYMTMTSPVINNFVITYNQSSGYYSLISDDQATVDTFKQYINGGSTIVSTNNTAIQNGSFRTVTSSYYMYVCQQSPTSTCRVIKTLFNKSYTPRSFYNTISPTVTFSNYSVTIAPRINYSFVELNDSNKPTIKPECALLYNYRYNPVYGTVQDNVISSLKKQIEYSTDSLGDLLPILSPVQLQDDNYTRIRHITPRYVGSKNTSPKPDYSTYNSSIVYPINSYTEYFVWFKSCEVTASIISSLTYSVIQFYPTYLVSSNNDIIKLGSLNSNLASLNSILSIYLQQTSVGQVYVKHNVTFTDTTNIVSNGIITNGLFSQGGVSIFGTGFASSIAILPNRVGVTVNSELGLYSTVFQYYGAVANIPTGSYSSPGYIVPYNYNPNKIQYISSIVSNNYSVLN